MGPADLRIRTGRTVTCNTEHTKASMDDDEGRKRRRGMGRGLPGCLRAPSCQSRCPLAKSPGRACQASLFLCSPRFVVPLLPLPARHPWSLHDNSKPDCLQVRIASGPCPCSTLPNNLAACLPCCLLCSPGPRPGRLQERRRHAVHRPSRSFD